MKKEIIQNPVHNNPPPLQPKGGKMKRIFIYLFKKKTNQAGNPTLKIYANCVEESARNQRLISSLKWIMNQLQM